MGKEQEEAGEPADPEAGLAPMKERGKGDGVGGGIKVLRNAMGCSVVLRKFQPIWKGLLSQGPPSEQPLSPRSETPNVPGHWPVQPVGRLTWLPACQQPRLEANFTAPPLLCAEAPARCPVDPEALRDPLRQPERKALSLSPFRDQETKPLTCQSGQH